LDDNIGTILILEWWFMNSERDHAISEALVDL